MKIWRISWMAIVMAWITMPWASNAGLLGGSENTDMTTLDAINTLHIANLGLSRTVLDNGMICLVKEDASAPVVAIQIWVGTGSIHENEYLGAGISHGIEHMIFKGTEKRKPTDITRDIDGAGGNINAYTSFDRTVFHVEMPSDQWKVGLDVLSDAVQHATYPEEEWVKEREVIIREIEMGRDDPERVISYLLWNTAYREHPYRYPVIGYEEVFSKLQRSDLADFAHKRYHPDNMIVVVVGNIKRAEVEKQVGEAFKGFDRQRSQPVVLPVEPAQAATRHARKVGDYKLARLEWAYHTVDQSHPDTPVLDVLSIIVGGGDSSRLVRTVKEEKRLAYSVNSYSYTPKSSGLFGISAVFEPLNEHALTDALTKEVKSWGDELFTQEEINKARRQILTSELSPLQTMSGQAGNYASGEFYAGDPRFAETYLQKVATVTPEQLRDVARRYFTPENLTAVVLSPLEEVTMNSATNAQIQVPLPAKIQLDSGARLLVRENNKLPFVYISVSVGGGVITETRQQSGVTKLMSGMLMRGTAKMDRQAVAEAIESSGASMAPYSGNDDFGITARCMASDVDQVMGILSDCLLNPAFKPEELEKEKADQLASISKAYEDPFFVAQDQMKKAVFGDHPYAMNAFGDTNSVQGLTRDAVMAHYRRHLVSDNVVISIFGAIDGAKAKELADKYFKALPTGKSPMADVAALKANPTLPVRKEKTEPREQAIVILGYPGVAQGDSRIPALAVLRMAMSGLSSELGNEVREKRGLAYYVGALNRAGVAPGVFAIYAGTTKKAAAEVEQLMLADVSRISTNGLSSEELERSRMQLLGDNDMRLQDDMAVARQCASDELTGLGYQYLFGAKDRIRAVTGEAVKACAATLLTTNLTAASIVLPVADAPAQDAK